MECEYKSDIYDIYRLTIAIHYLQDIFIVFIKKIGNEILFGYFRSENYFFVPVTFRNDFFCII